MRNKATTTIIVGIFLIAILFFILDEDEFKELWQTIFGFTAIFVICMIGWANADSPVDNSRNTIDWELEQEAKEKQDEEDFIRKTHKK